MFPNLRAFLVCRDVLKNSRNDSVISIINIFNELRVSKFPIFIDSICLVAIYGGVQGEFTHHFEIWEKDELLTQTPKETFFLEDRNAMFHVVAYIDGMTIEKPRHFVLKTVLNGIVQGEVTLGIFKPLKEGLI